MRSWLPDAVGGIVWWGNDDANMVPYTPVYCGVSEIPECYVRIAGEQDELVFSWKSAFWMQNTVSNMVYPYYSKIYPDLRKAIDELETAYAKEIADIDNEGKKLCESQPNAVGRYLANYSNRAANQMMERWESLFRYLVVKHNDMVVKREKDGQFERTPDGYAAPTVRPGYPTEFGKRIVKETGNRYKMK